MNKPIKALSKFRYLSYGRASSLKRKLEMIFGLANPGKRCINNPIDSKKTTGNSRLLTGNPKFFCVKAQTLPPSKTIHSKAIGCNMLKNSPAITAIANKIAQGACRVVRGSHKLSNAKVNGP